MLKKVVPMALILMAGCTKGQSGNEGPSGGAPPAREPSRPGPARPSNRAPADLSRLTRQQFNQAAVRLNLPLYWIQDVNKNGRPEPSEVVDLLFYPTRGHWTEKGKFTKAFYDAYERMVADTTKPDLGNTPSEQERRRLVRLDLDQGRPTLVLSDLRGLSGQEKTFFSRMLEAAQLIDRLYATQLGIDVLAPKVPRDDPSSQSLFRRNWGPDCKAPKTEKNPKCTAIPGVHKPPVGIYPKGLQKESDFCKKLAKSPDAPKLMAPFVSVAEKDGKLTALPFNQAFPKLMQAVSAKLLAAAQALQGTSESALVAYLRAAAKSFATNDWLPADEAWAKMSAENSKWYVRVAPDEVYWDPCSRKAGFHLTLARINPKSLEWQKKLTPVRQEMEDNLAKLIGKPYKARKVSFHLPDFIDIVLNAGDDRKAFGATIGQSLPNWGPVANEGRGRTVVMTNLYTDPDSLAIQRAQAASLLTKETMALYHPPKEPDVLGTILHEATHNLGPAHEYKVHGKTAPQIFGGPLASTLEELKAQTGALYFLQFLLEKKLITKQQMDDSYVYAFLWMMGHISRGMYSPGHKPKPYSHLSAIQLGFLMKEGAVVFDPKAPAANGRDKGAFTLHLDKFPAAVQKLMKLVGHIKAAGDKKAAEGLVKEFVDGNVVPFALIKERMLRAPKASFVYAVRL